MNKTGRYGNELDLLGGYPTVAESIHFDDFYNYKIELNVENDGASWWACAYPVRYGDRGVNTYFVSEAGCIHGSDLTRLR
ncbi:MAG: hypothetical protein V1809_15840 [Planctomycetota bacterium]